MPLFVLRIALTSFSCPELLHVSPLTETFVRFMPRFPYTYKSVFRRTYVHTILHVRACVCEKEDFTASTSFLLL